MSKSSILFSKKCNIDKTDRINRIVIGIILLIAALLRASWVFYLAAAIILIIEGIIGICYIPKVIYKINCIIKNKQDET